MHRTMRPPTPHSMVRAASSTYRTLPQTLPYRTSSTGHPQDRVPTLRRRQRVSNLRTTARELIHSIGLPYVSNGGLENISMSQDRARYAIHTTASELVPRALSSDWMDEIAGETTLDTTTDASPATNSTRVQRSAKTISSSATSIASTSLSSVSSTKSTEPFPDFDNSIANFLLADFRPIDYNPVKSKKSAYTDENASISPLDRISAKHERQVLAHAQPRVGEHDGLRATHFTFDTELGHPFLGLYHVTVNADVAGLRESRRDAVIDFGREGVSDEENDETTLASSPGEVMREVLASAAYEQLMLERMHGFPYDLRRSSEDEEPRSKLACGCGLLSAVVRCARVMYRM